MFLLSGNMSRKGNNPEIGRKTIAFIFALFFVLICLFVLFDFFLCEFIFFFTLKDRNLNPLEIESSVIVAPKRPTLNQTRVEWEK